MVNLEYINKIVQELETFHIQKNQFRLDGSSYSLILFIPLSQYESLGSFDLVLSNKLLENMSKKESISEILTWLQNKLSNGISSSIKSIIVLNTNAPMIKNLNLIVPIKEGLKELNDIHIGEVYIQKGILVHTNILEKIKTNRACTVELQNGKFLNMGIDEIDKDFNISYYTGQGLKILFGPNRSSEEIKNASEILKKGKTILKKRNLYSTINIKDIKRVSN